MIYESTNRVLIIRLSSFGDIILTTPFIRALKKKYPSIQIDYLIGKQYAELIRNNPFLDNIFEYDKTASNKKLIEQLRSVNYDLIIDLHNNLRTRRITSKLKGKVRRYKKPNLKKYLLVNFKWNLLKQSKPVPERYAEAIPGLKPDGQGPEYFFPGLELVNQDAKLIGFCPGSRHYTKMWPADYFIELGNLLVDAGYKIVLLGGKDDKNICAELESKIRSAENKCNDNDVRATATEMKRCKAVVCNDSGLMHLATAINVPVTAIFGSTVREFGFFPYKAKSLVLENNSISCRPCTHIGRANCPEEHFKCMKEITPKIVFDNINKYLTLDD